MRDVFICDAIRTPIGRFGGGLSTVRADDLAALPIKALMERNPSVDWSSVDEVFPVSYTHLTLPTILLV